MEPTPDRTHDTRRPSVIEDALRDVLHVFRMLRRSPGFTAAALLTLALGIGATSAVFSVVRTVMLEPPPYRDPDRIVAVWETNRGGTSRNVIAPANFVAWRERVRTLEHLGMVGPANLVLMIDGQPSNVSGLTMSADVFAALGVGPALGRAYTVEEDFGGRSTVIVLSYEFWQSRLGGRDVLGTTLSTGSGPATVIGVMPPGFTVVGQKADFLIPYGQSLEQLRAAGGRGLIRHRATSRRRFVRASGDRNALDPTTFAATSFALLTIATVAAYIPARRSMRWLPSTRSEQTIPLIGRFVTTSPH